jgi:hypothetical protein
MRRTPADKAEAARTINEALAAGWAGGEIAERLPLEEVAAAHDRVESPARAGRVVCFSEFRLRLAFRSSQRPSRPETTR